MSGRLHAVVELPQFIRDADAAGLSGDERERIVNAVAADPLQGDEVRGSGGVRKIRVAGRGKGKSGGHRIMVAYIGENVPVYLLALLSKGDRGNFSTREIATMHEVIVAIKRGWRKRT